MAFINLYDPFAIGLLATIFLVVALIGLILFVHARSIRRCNHLQEQISDLKDDVANLCAAAIHVDGQRNKIDLRLNNVLERMATLEQCQGGSKTYHTAISEVKNGADAQYLVDACGFSRGEAEFMVNLYGDVKGETGDSHVVESGINMDSASH